MLFNFSPLRQFSPLHRTSRKLTFWGGIIGAIAEKSTYKRWLIGSGIVSLIMASQFGLYVTFLTLGLGVVFWIAPTVFIYLLCCLPLALLREDRILGVGLSLALAIGVATIPRVYIQKRTNALLVEKTSNDFSLTSTTDLEKIGGLEIEFTSRRKPYGRHHALEDGLCKDICEYLLNTGKADWIRLKYLETARSNNQVKIVETTTYTNGQTNKCQGANKVPGMCIETSPNSVRDADVRITIIDTTAKSETAEITKTRTAEVAFKNTSSVIKQTQVNYNRLFAPTILIAPSSTDMEFNIIPLPIAEKYNEIELDIIFTRLGVSIGEYVKSGPPPFITRAQTPSEYSKTPTESETNQVVAILNQRKNAPLSSDQKIAIDKWLRKAQYYDVWSSANLSLVKRIFNQNANDLRSLYTLDHRLRHKQVFDALVPKAMSDAGLKDRVEANRIVFRAARRRTPEQIAPYRNQLVSILNDNFEDYPSLVRMSGSHLNVNPVIYMRKALSAYDKDGQNTGNMRLAAETACYANKKWAPQITQYLKPMLTPTDLAKAEPSLHSQRILMALYKQGDVEFVESTVMNSGWNKTRLIRDLKNIRKPRRGNTGCESID